MPTLLQHPRLLAILRYTGYTLFFVLILLVAVPFTFPTRQLKSLVLRQARAQGYPLELDSISLKGLGGIEVGGVKLTLPGRPGEPGENGALGPDTPSAELRIDKLSAKIALFPAIFGKTIDLSFNMEAGGGSIADGRFVQKGENIDFEIGKINQLGLSGLGMGKRMLSGVKQISGELDGDLAGSAKVHYGGSTEDLSGNVDLELADAILKSPELNMEGGLKLADLAMGAITIKVKMGLKQNIAALAGKPGAEKATVLHIETMEAVGDQLELITEETSHILIPPGKAGWKAATIQLHFAFSLPDKAHVEKGKKDGDKADAEKADAKAADGKDADGKDAAKKDKTDKSADARIKWASILSPDHPLGKAISVKLKPFERNGFIGIGCVGPLTRPQCKPEIPQVTVGTRGKGDGALPKPDAPPHAGDAPVPPGTPVVVPPPAQIATPPVEFKPVIRPDTPVVAPVVPPTPAPEEKKPEPVPEVKPPVVEPPKSPEVQNNDRGGDKNGDEAEQPRGRGRGRGRDAPAEEGAGRGGRGRDEEPDDKKDNGGEGKEAPAEGGEQPR